MPRATYRLQLRPDFGFEAAAELADYLAALGVSHLYASPYLQAAPGSSHGYDVVDPTRVNRELGAEEGHQVLCDALAAAGLGQILDVVPNHMSIRSHTNRWWWDVLENGHASAYAGHFDVDWTRPEDDRILLPILGDQFGRVLEAGELRLVRRGGSFVVTYYDNEVPVAPRSLGGPLGVAAERIAHEELAFLADSLAELPAPQVTDRASVERRHRDKAILGRRLTELLEDEAVAEAVDAVIAEIVADPEALGDLLDEQSYRLAYWRAASGDLGYRRFFDIDSLVGLRVEDPHVFAETHRLVLDWLRRGVLDGIRIDHPDGLRDPEGYLRRLRDAAPDAWIVVEKIVHPGEPLPDTWPVQGTTGYDFLNLVTSLLIDPAAEEAMTSLYGELTGAETDFATVVTDAKRQVAEDLLGSDLRRLVALARRVCERHRRHRDHTARDLHHALRELAVATPVYRTYVRREGSSAQATENDIAVLDQAMAAAREADPEVDAELFDFLYSILLLRWDGVEEELAMRFQQITGPMAAKGVEDTAFYRYHRLVAACEVGGDPGRFGISTDGFHAAMQRTAERWPQAMLSSSTHDTKRSEDVRARLAVLSEMPERWGETVRRWFERNERHRSDVLDRNTEYLLYQTLVGAWPLPLDRLLAYLEKACREAKVHTSWSHPSPEYEAAVADFARALDGDEAFQQELAAFTEPLVEAGRVNALAQTLIKLTAPGVPDVYQGCELWDFSLVDPDNRREVDFARRRHLLAELDGMDVAGILARMDEGVPKLHVVRRALRVRADRPSVFEGDYQPADVRGPRRDRVVAFARGGQVVTCVPRLWHSTGGDWGETSLTLPPGRWRNVLTDDEHEAGDHPVAEIWRRFPVALLVKE